MESLGGIIVGSNDSGNPTDLLQKGTFNICTWFRLFFVKSLQVLVSLKAFHDSRVSVIYPRKIVSGVYPCIKMTGNNDSMCMIGVLGRPGDFLTLFIRGLSRSLLVTVCWLCINIRK